MMFHRLNSVAYQGSCRVGNVFQNEIFTNKKGSLPIKKGLTATKLWQITLLVSSEDTYFLSVSVVESPCARQVDLWRFVTAKGMRK